MLNMPKVNSIRDKALKGTSFRQIAKEENVDWKTVKKYVHQNDFSPQLPTSDRRSSMLDPYKDRISQWLLEDRERWHKQRHTAKRIFDRLQEEHDYTGSYSTVRRYVREAKDQLKEQKEYGDLVWEKGEAQCDFGEAEFFENGVRVRRSFLVLSFPYSNVAFYQVFRSENSESICQGLQNIFTHIRKVPHRIVFDNAPGIGQRISGVFKENDLFSKFRQHHRFLADFCNPNAGHEKGHVENKVGMIRRNEFVPEPHYTDLEIFNQRELERTDRQLVLTHYKKNRTLGELFAEECLVMQSPNPKVFQAIRMEYRRADKYGKVCVDGPHFYATLPEMGGKNLLLVLSAEKVEIYRPDNNQLLVTHRREYGKIRTDSDNPWATLHYLSRHPKAWENSPLRQVMEPSLREKLDEQSRTIRSRGLKLLDRLRQDMNTQTACEALLHALKADVNHLETSIIFAKRIQDGGIDIEPLPGPDLTAYDFLLQKEESPYV